MDPRPAIEDEPLADLANSILTIARKLAQRSDELADVIALNGTEAQVMRAVHHHPGLSATEVAARLGLQRSNVSVALGVLELHGLVVKRRSADDARALELIATEKAVRNLERVRLGWAGRLRTADDEVLRKVVAVRDILAKLASELDAPAEAQ